MPAITLVHAIIIIIITANTETTLYPSIFQTRHTHFNVVDSPWPLELEDMVLINAQTHANMHTNAATPTNTYTKFVPM